MTARERALETAIRSAVGELRPFAVQLPAGERREFEAAIGRLKAAAVSAPEQGEKS